MCSEAYSLICANRDDYYFYDDTVGEDVYYGPEGCQALFDARIAMQEIYTAGIQTTDNVRLTIAAADCTLINDILFEADEYVIEAFVKDLCIDVDSDEKA